jgi:dienelactone hydrolase
VTNNPFIKGNYPVGVRTIELAGEANNYTTEVWYPAADEYRGKEAIDTFKYVDELPPATQEASRDAKPADGRRPLVMYWHGGYGHRREAAANCVFLASHGFIVAAADFPGDHVTHTFGSDPLLAKQTVDESAKARPRQAAEIVELVIGSDNNLLSSVIDPAAGVGSFGMSMGGFTTLAVNSTSDRMKASLAICPMTGTRGMIPGIKRLNGILRTDDWKSAVSTIVLTGSEDCFVILDDVRELHTRISEPKRLVVLNGAGHIHWADNAELIHETMRARYASGEFPDPEIDGPKLARLMRPFSELCPASHATDSQRSIAAALFEAELKQNIEARAFLENDLAGTFAKRGVDLEVTAKVESAGA